jgi:tetratricopeptide (TPR) repeat protein
MMRSALSSAKRAATSMTISGASGGSYGLSMPVKFLILPARADGFLSLASLGYAYAVSGQPNEARQILDELKDLSTKGYISPNHLAVVHAGLGEKDQALEYLEKTYQERDEMQRFIKVSPIFDNLHSDPRFIDLLHRVGLSQ